MPASTGATDAALAVAPDGSPRVAFVGAAGAVVVAARAADGTWTEQALPGAARAAGARRRPRGRPKRQNRRPRGGSAARWLALAEQNGASWSVRTVATAPKGGLLGFGGLALDRAGSPFVAYAYQLPSRKSWLRLVHEDARAASSASG